MANQSKLTYHPFRFHSTDELIGKMEEVIDLENQSPNIQTKLSRLYLDLSNRILDKHLNSIEFTMIFLQAI